MTSGHTDSARIQRVVELSHTVQQVDQVEVRQSHPVEEVGNYSPVPEEVDIAKEGMAVWNLQKVAYHQAEVVVRCS
jgi:ribosomal protein S16